MCAWGCELCLAFEHFVSTTRSYVTSVQQEHTDCTCVQDVFTLQGNFLYRRKKKSFLSNCKLNLSHNPKKFKTFFSLSFLQVKFWGHFLCFCLVSVWICSRASCVIVLDLTQLYQHPYRNNANCRLQVLACFKSKHKLKVFGAAGQSRYLCVKYCFLRLGQQNWQKLPHKLISFLVIWFHAVIWKFCCWLSKMVCSFEQFDVATFNAIGGGKWPNLVKVIHNTLLMVDFLLIYFSPSRLTVVQIKLLKPMNLDLYIWRLQPVVNELILIK